MVKFSKICNMPPPPQFDVKEDLVSEQMCFFLLEFFSKYVDQKLPLIILGGVKTSPAFTKWSNSYFRQNPEIMKMGVSVDRDKKELNNITDYRHMTFSKFLDRFQKEELYLVDGVKKHLQ